MADTEQEGAPSATAGGASAPDAVGTIRRVGERSFVLCDSPNGDRHWVQVAGGGHIVDGDFWRVDTRPVVGAVPGTPAARDPRDAEIERLREELHAKEQRSFDNYAELLNPIRAVFGKQPVDASHYRELRDGITRLISSHSVEATRHEQAKVEFGDLIAERDRKRRELADVTAEVTRLKRLVGNEDVSYDGWDQCSRHDAIVRCEEGWQEYLKVRDERDRLRQELDLIHERHAAGLVTLRTDFTAAVNGLLPKPAEPRRWTAGDPEPEIGTTVRPANSKLYGGPYTRRHNGWHTDFECPPDCEKAGGSWSWVTSHTGGLVEVVNSNG